MTAPPDGASRHGAHPTKDDRMAAAKKDYIARYAFKVPLLFEGDRGSGKTYDVREFARVNKHPYVEIAGHESVEAIDFLGHHMQSPMGVVWKDGRLSRAFRQGAAGQKVALLIDEMLRIPQRHLSVLLSALSPDSTGHYRLQTGRMVDVQDGVGVEEEILCPAANLAIFATTNVGPEFAIDDLDPAVAERFIIARKDTEKATLENILRSTCSARSFSSTSALRLSELFERTKRMVDTGTLNRHATTRTLTRAVEHATDEADIKNVLKDQILLWADRDSAGRPVEAQCKQLEKAIDELFPDSRPSARPASSSSKSAPRASASRSARSIYGSPKIHEHEAEENIFEAMVSFDDHEELATKMLIARELSDAKERYEGDAHYDVHGFAKMLKEISAREGAAKSAAAAEKSAAKSIAKPASAPKVDPDRVELVKGVGRDREFLILEVARSKSDPALWALETSAALHDRRKTATNQSSPLSYSGAASAMIKAKKNALSVGYFESTEQAEAVSKSPSPAFVHPAKKDSTAAAWSKIHDAFYEEPLNETVEPDSFGSFKTGRDRSF